MLFAKVGDKKLNLNLVNEETNMPVIMHMQ